jgi:putative transposase
MKRNAKIREAIKIDADVVRGHMGKLLRVSVEDTLNSMLKADADEFCKFKRDGRSADRAGTPSD